VIDDRERRRAQAERLGFLWRWLMAMEPHVVELEAADCARRLDRLYGEVVAKVAGAIGANRELMSRVAGAGYVPGVRDDGPTPHPGDRLVWMAAIRYAFDQEAGQVVALAPWGAKVIGFGAASFIEQDPDRN
jgi:hypothetical protein